MRLLVCQNYEDQFILIHGKKNEIQFETNIRMLTTDYFQREYSGNYVKLSWVDGVFDLCVDVRCTKYPSSWWIFFERGGKFFEDFGGDVTSENEFLKYLIFIEVTVKNYKMLEKM